MVGLEILIQVKTNKRQEFLQAFEMLSKLGTQQDACLNQSLFEDVVTPNRFLWVEKWSASEPLEDHVGTNRFKTMLGAVQVLGSLEDLRFVETKSLEDLPCF